jgi:outer membrane murein-binding lipoprotein Lpp
VPSVRLLALIACVAGFALVAAGCGGDGESDTTSADAWAEEFCTAVQDWGDELERIGQDLGDVSSLSSASLEDAADETDVATEDFVETIRDLGTPDTESGDRVESEIDALADTVDAEREEIRRAVEDASGLGGVADAVGTIGTSIAAMGTSLQETLEAIDSADVDGELQTALEDSEACDELTS